MKIRPFAAALVLANLTLCAWAGPVLLTDRTTFEAQGDIAEFQDFEGFDSTGFTFPGDPFVDGSVTYTSEGDNLIVGSGTSISPISNTMSYDLADTALTADIGGSFTLFALDMAINDVDNAAQPITLTLFTNVASYLFDVVLPDVQDEQLFQGFVVGGGEFFTGFAFDIANFVHIDNVTLGDATVAVPEPAALILVMAGMLAAGFVQRRQIRFG